MLEMIKQGKHTTKKYSPKTELNLQPIKKYKGKTKTRLYDVLWTEQNKTSGGEQNKSLIIVKWRIYCGVTKRNKEIRNRINIKPDIKKQIEENAIV